MTDSGRDHRRVLLAPRISYDPGRLLHVLMLVGVSFMMLCQASGQNVTFTASVDKNRVAVGEAFQVTFSLNGSSSGKNFRPPAFGSMQILSGPNQSTNMQFINGVMSSSVSYNFILAAQSEGKVTIGQAAIDYNGTTLTTRPVLVEVVKGSSRPQSQQSNDDDAEKQIGENLFLKVAVDKSRAIQGEQITVTYKIYTRVSVVNYNLTKVPALTGFWSEDLEVPKQVQLSTEVVNGRQYRVGVLKKVALFPQRDGTLEIDPMEVECVVQIQTRRRSNDFFDQFFADPFGNVKNVSYKVKSETVRVHVAPLPTAGISAANFGGAVGKFSMNAWLDKTETRTNEPVTLRVKVSGTGNLKLLEAPVINVPPDMERYDPKISDNIGKSGGKVSGSRTFEYLLIPRHPGAQRIPSFPFTYYDLEKKSYVTLTSPAFQLAVSKGADAVGGAISGMSKEDVKLLSEDIRFIKSGEARFRKKGETFVGSVAFFILTVAPILGFAGFILFARGREKVMGDAASMRNRKARKMAQRRLVEAKKYLDQKKEEQFYSETSRAIWGYISDKLAIPPADLSLDSVRAALERRSVAPETIERLHAALQQCEFARFAPSKDSLRMDGMYSQTVDLISTIEAQIK